MENKNELFEMPTASVVVFDNEDVITTSVARWGENGFRGVSVNNPGALYD